MKENKLFLIIIACAIFVGVFLGIITKSAFRGDQIKCLESTILSKIPEKSPLPTGQMEKPKKIIFLHHSTGYRIWEGGVLQWFEKYNSKNGTNYLISEQAFPNKSPHGWKNLSFSSIFINSY